MCRQIHSTLITTVSKVRGNWIDLKNIIMSATLQQQLGQFRAWGRVKGKDRTPERNTCYEAERMLIHQSSQTKKTFHSALWKVKRMVSWKKESEFFQPVFPLRNPQTTPLKKQTMKAPQSPSNQSWPWFDCTEWYLSLVLSWVIYIKNREALCTACKSVEKKSKLCPTILISSPQALFKHWLEMKMYLFAVATQRTFPSSTPKRY